ncbi:nicastrin [Heterostelium album PN500]|uniref:Nicastrin n=1 Tax=Heterostelium pallidum (strain ATCC 26659 / Pp 5 / PN500) TaxID=670386 RepID=D3BHE5_HETP5|nr:nicastrin [Heterostelium album PN500]EFA79122.1 nicastrin [Heterostelium album PN500]|eukprot:XP_020431244.1 nicastrin [Heterostelium album PN500]
MYRFSSSIYKSFTLNINNNNISNYSSSNRYSCKIMYMLVLLLVLLLDHGCYAQSNSAVSQRIYTNVGRPLPCSRLLDVNGQFGCTSKEFGNSGLVHLVDSDASLADLPSHAIAVLDANFFNGTIVNRIISKVEGIVVLTDTKQNYRYSPDLPVPNAPYGLYPKPTFSFNSAGDSLSYQSFDKPFFVLDKNNSAIARSYGNWNRDGNLPQYGCHLESFMHAAINAQTCLRRSFCVPVGGKSSWSTFSPEFDQSSTIIMVSVPLDATAFFHDLAYGSQTSAYGQTVLLGIVEALSRVANQTSTWKYTVIFAAYDGERWGYLGSTKLVDDIINTECKKYTSDGYGCLDPRILDVTFMNISFTKIKFIVELNQIGNPLKVDGSGHYVYALNSLKSNANNPDQQLLYQTFADVAKELAGKVKISTQPVDQDEVPEIPPSSSMAYLKQNPNIPTIIVTDHFGVYTNNYFSSHNDDYTNINANIIVDAVTYFATVIDRLAGGNNTIVQNSLFVEDMLDCLTKNFTCKYAQQFAGSSQPVPSFYTSVYGYGPDNQYLTIQSLFVHSVMAYFAASNRTGIMCDESNSCPESAQACIGGTCVITNSHFHDAISLGFTFDEPSYSWVIGNTSYPTYVESNWNSIVINFYQQDSHTTEALFLVFGIIEMFVVIAIIFVSKRYLSKRYKLLMGGFENN